MSKKPISQDEQRLDFLVEHNNDSNDVSGDSISSKEPTADFEMPIKKRKWGRKLVLAVAFLIFLASSLLYVRVFASPLGANINEVSWFTTLKHLLTNEEKTINGEKQDQINVLILGMGGEGHDGAYLTDTIIVASFKPSTKQVALVSIPRDLYVDISGYGWRKVNHANAYGEVDGYDGGGAALAADTIEQVIGQEIPYYIRFDFNGFKKLVDDLGGVTVNIEHPFTDTQYPDYQHGVQTVSFKSGEQTLNSEQALQYARSRHGTNGQGSDFSRSRRQMQIIMAVKDKVLSAGTLLNPSKLSDLYNNASENIETNIKLWEALRFASMARGIDADNIMNKVIDNGPEGLLTSYISETGAYVLTPKSGNFSQIHSFFDSLFSNSEVVAKPNIIIYNGTFLPGYASETSEQLSNQGYAVQLIGNAPTRDWTSTVVYDLTDGENLQSLNELEQILNAQTGSELPFDVQEKILHDNISPEHFSETDFVIVLGTEE